MEQFNKLLFDIKEYFNSPIITIGDAKLTLWTITYFLVGTFLLIYVTGKIRKWIVYKLLAKSKIDIGIRAATGSIVRYLFLSIGFVIILQTAGINLSSLTILAGALGVGIGFGLQNITNNFVSGLIILIERPIKVGDRIEIGDISGDVINISMRAATILTNDNISIIVPNSDFISSKVINWSLADRNVRLNFHVPVSYNEDVIRIKNILLEIVNNNDGVLKTPKPDILLDKFAESSMVFTMRVWTSEYINRPGVLRSKLYYDIAERFKKENIKIPNPQMDIHIKD